jgi:glutamyl-tRNA reductase
MKLVLVGLNHRTAPLEVRERFSPSSHRWIPLNEKLLGTSGIREAAILSTCNRTEVIGVSDEAEDGLDQLCDFLREEIGPGALDARHLYRLEERDAAVHLLRVASSLDSMVLGEAQILGQVKEAYRAAVDARSCGPTLNRLFQRAFRAAKRVRTETGLGGSAVSVARVGLQLARELFESFEGKRVVLLGAGAMAESALDGLREAGVGSVVVVNRTLETAQRLATRFRGRPVRLDELQNELPGADVLLASVQVSEPLIVRATVERALAERHGRPLLVIDLGLPRNADPEIAELENLYLYDLDDLEEIAERGRARRREAVRASERIILEEFEGFERWRATLGVVPTIQDLMAKAEALAREEVERTLAGLPEADPVIEAAVQRLAEGIVHKLLHRPVVGLRSAAADGTGIYYADAMRQLFALEEEEEG